jgi:hypothetical protein
MASQKMQKAALVTRDAHQALLDLNNRDRDRKKF